MALLSAEDILHKAFPTEGPEPGTGGYTQDAVDDFLDEVAATVRALHASAAAQVDSGAQQASGLLALASKMHDEHIAEAQAQAAQIIREAQDAADAQLGELEVQRAALEVKVNELEQFEVEYRTDLRTHLQKLIEHVSAPAEPA